MTVQQETETQGGETPPDSGMDNSGLEIVSPPSDIVIPEIDLGFVTGTNIKRTRKKVAIVGFAPSSMTDVRALFGDPDFEIWGLNQLYVSFPMITQYATRWFQIHNRQSYDQAVRDHKHHDWLAAQTAFPIYMQKGEPDIPCAVTYPWQLMLNEFGDYFTNSISWEIALAIHEGFEAIHIYGVDMAQDEEYQNQRPSCEYFIGLARGGGIDVYVPAKSDLCKTMWLYPLEDDAKFRTKIEGRRVELRQRVDELAAQEAMCHDQRMQLIGALENMNYINKCWNVSSREMALDKPHDLSNIEK